MEPVILVIHLFLALAIIGLVLLQRSEGGGLGIGGGGLGGLASPRGTANMLTKATGICAAGFFCTSLILGIMAGGEHKARQGLMQALEETPAQVQQEEKSEPGETKDNNNAPSAPLSGQP